MANVVIVNLYQRLAIIIKTLILKRTKKKLIKKGAYTKVRELTQ